MKKDLLSTKDTKDTKKRIKKDLFFIFVFFVSLRVLRGQKGIHMTTLIKNGRIITATDDYVGDVFIDGETIHTIGKHLPMPADRTIDATGKLVIPGGIDPHVHMELPFGGTVSVPTISKPARSRRRLAGRLRSSISRSSTKARRSKQTLDDWDPRRGPKCAIDYSYHLAVTEYEPRHKKEFAEVVDRGITTFKIFLAYPGVFMIDDTTMFRVMQSRGRSGRIDAGARGEWHRDQRDDRQPGGCGEDGAEVSRAVAPADDAGGWRGAGAARWRGRQGAGLYRSRLVRSRDERDRPLAR